MSNSQIVRIYPNIPSYTTVYHTSEYMYIRIFEIDRAENVAENVQKIKTKINENYNEFLL